MRIKFTQACSPITCAPTQGEKGPLLFLLPPPHPAPGSLPACSDRSRLTHLPHLSAVLSRTPSTFLLPSGLRERARAGPRAGVEAHPDREPPGPQGAMGHGLPACPSSLRRPSLGSWASQKGEWCLLFFLFVYLGVSPSPSVGSEEAGSAPNPLI